MISQMMDTDTKEVVLRPSDIHYTQGTISTKFTNGTPIGQLIDDVVSGKCLVSDIKRIEVKLVDGFWFSADNRRLWVFKQLEFIGHCPVITAKVVKRVYGNKCTSENGGLDVCLRGGDPGGIWFSKISEIREKLSKNKESTAFDNNALQTGFSKEKLSKNNELERIESSKVPVFQYDPLQNAHGNPENSVPNKSKHKAKNKMDESATASSNSVHEKRSKSKGQTNQNKAQNLLSRENKRQHASGNKILNSNSKGIEKPSDKQDSVCTAKLESKFIVTTGTVVVTECSKQRNKKKQQAQKKRAICANARAQGIATAIKGTRRSNLDGTNGSHSNIQQSMSEGKKTANEDSICKNIKAKRPKRTYTSCDKKDDPKTNANLRKAKLQNTTVLRGQTSSSHKQVKCKTDDVESLFPAAMTYGIEIINAEINNSVCGRDQEGQNDFSGVTDTGVKRKKKGKKRRKKTKPLINSVNDVQNEQYENHADYSIRPLPFPGFQFPLERNDKEIEDRPIPGFLQTSVYDSRITQSRQNFAYFSGTCENEMCINWSDMSDTECTDGMNIDEDTTIHDDDDDLLGEINNYSDDELNLSLVGGLSCVKTICNTNHQPSWQEGSDGSSSDIPGYFQNAGAEFVSKNYFFGNLFYNGNYDTRNIHSGKNTKAAYSDYWPSMDSDSSLVSALDPFGDSDNSENYTDKLAFDSECIIGNNASKPKLVAESDFVSSDKISFDTECIIGNDTLSTKSDFINRNMYLHGVRAKENNTVPPGLGDFNDNLPAKLKYQDSEVFKVDNTLADDDIQNGISFHATFSHLYRESIECGSPSTTQKPCKQAVSLDKTPKHWCTIL